MPKFEISYYQKSYKTSLVEANSVVEAKEKWHNNEVLEEWEDDADFDMIEINEVES